MFAVLQEEDCNNLHEAKASDEWPEWERAIHTELDQLKCMGTWKLVDKPPSVIPIANKFVFAKKRDKEGNVTDCPAYFIFTFLFRLSRSVLSVTPGRFAHCLPTYRWTVLAFSRDFHTFLQASFSFHDLLWLSSTFW